MLVCNEEEDVTQSGGLIPSLFVCVLHKKMFMLQYSLTYINVVWFQLQYPLYI